jgi:hypothetical protein
MAEQSAPRRESGSVNLPLRNVERDERNGIVDGRDLALQCMVIAYSLLGPYAKGDYKTYQRLIRITAHLAELEVHMRGEEIPSLILAGSGEEDPTRLARIQRHLEETVGRTAALLEMDEGMGGH